MNEKLTLFFGKTNPELSNLYVAPIEIGGKVYNSTEHYFMYQKAKLFDPDGDAIKKMGNDLTPTQVKKLGRQVKNFDSDIWAEKRAAAYVPRTDRQIHPTPGIERIAFVHWI